jgi:hypothetical protein
MLYSQHRNSDKSERIHQLRKNWRIGETQVAAIARSLESKLAEIERLAAKTMS